MPQSHSHNVDKCRLSFGVSNESYGHQYTWFKWHPGGHRPISPDSQMVHPISTQVSQPRQPDSVNSQSEIPTERRETRKIQVWRSHHNAASCQTAWPRFTISRYRFVNARRADFPQITIGMVMPLTARLIIPHAINIFWIPLRWTHGVVANGIAILTAFRMNATAVKASPVI